ncbi:hypothetical protein GCM10010302_65650 [Streptomyces polychromogenes]|uniref:Uncharacterized protein n=1 Tax=Streptomyces polychromogenes TaxID=67342 RepID=A0ABP3FJ54_9ACTN
MIRQPYTVEAGQSAAAAPAEPGATASVTGRGGPDPVGDRDVPTGEPLFGPGPVVRASTAPAVPS